MHQNKRKWNESYLPIILLLFYAYANSTIGITRLFSGTFLIVYIVALFCLILFNVFIENIERTNNKHNIIGKLEFATIIILIITLCSCIFSDEKINALLSLIAILTAFIVPKKLLLNSKARQIFIILTFFYCLGSIINMLSQNFYTSVMIPLFKDNIQGNLRQKLIVENMYFAGFTSQVAFTAFYIAIGGAFAFCFRKLGRASYAESILTMIVTIIGMFLTAKRGPIVYFIIAAVFIYLLESKGKQQAIRGFEVIGLLVVLYIILIYLANSNLDIPGIRRIADAVQLALNGEGVSDTGRSGLWEEALSQFKSHLIVGVGWENFHLISTRQTHAHNIYIQLLAETGIIGAVCYYLFFAYSIIFSIRKYLLYKYDQNANALCGWMKVSIFIQFYVLMYGLSGNPIYDNEMAIFYYFSIGIIITIDRIEIENNSYLIKNELI